MSHLGFFDARYLLLPPAAWAQAGPITEGLREVGWPFGPLRASPWFDADRLPPPEDWQESPAAWTRIQSHARVLEEALHVRAERVLVVEHGVRFAAGLGERWEAVIAEADPRWTGMRLYGGRPDQPIAYALQRSGLPRLYRSLRDGRGSGDFVDRFAALRRGGVRRGTVQLGAGGARSPVVVAVVGGPGALDRASVGSPAADQALHRLIDRATAPGTSMPGPELRAHLEVFRDAEATAAAQSGRAVLAVHPRLADVGQALADVFGADLVVVCLGDPPPPWATTVHGLPADAGSGAIAGAVAEALRARGWTA